MSAAARGPSARGQSVDQRHVFVMSAGRRGTAPVEGDHQRRTRDQAGEKTRQRSFPANHGDRHVKCAGKADRHPAVASPERLSFVGEQAAQPFDVVGPDLPRHLECDCGLDQPPAEENVLRVGDRRGGHKGAAMAFDRHDMVVCEGLKRGAHDRAADVKDGAELFLGQFRARWQPLVDDGVEYATVDRSDATALAGAGFSSAAVDAASEFIQDNMVRTSRNGAGAGTPFGASTPYRPMRKSKARGHFVYNLAEIVDIGA